MFIYSFKANKRTIFGALLVLLALVVLCFAVPGRAKQTNSVLGVSLKGETNQERIAFIEHFGYDIVDEPVEVKDITIPAQFNDTYISYNEIQVSQGFDLNQYKGKQAKSYSYAVKNYPEIKDSEKTVRANLIVYHSKIIAGDVCSVKLDGFMHAFNYGKTG
ncbi:MAG: DUF4830 domain-containing protein [Ruminococcaceae bacterium]|nr:DUF4830 domain-containing protein [Oscillospiraceae bacterium]